MVDLSFPCHTYALLNFTTTVFQVTSKLPQWIPQCQWSNDHYILPYFIYIFVIISTLFLFYFYPIPPARIIPPYSTLTHPIIYSLAAVHSHPLMLCIMTTLASTPWPHQCIPPPPLTVSTPKSSFYTGLLHNPKTESHYMHKYTWNQMRCNVFFF